MHISSAFVRRGVQTGFAVFCLFIGWRFYGFYLWLTGVAPVMVSRPPSVEAFLPISALLGLKSFLTTGVFDRIHPAGLAVLLAVMVSALVFRRGFCGYICPVGLISDVLTRLGKGRVPYIALPRWVDMGLRSIKYILLLFFVGTVFVGMDLVSVESFLRSPYNILADVKMLQFFASPSLTFGLVVGALALAGIVIPRFWCRYLCPYGALVEVCALSSPVAVQRDPEACIRCGKCTRVCPEGIVVEKKERVSSPACMLCMRCVEVCPAKDALDIKVLKTRSLAPYWIAVGLVGCIFAGYCLAALTGHWHTEVSPDMVRMLLQKG